MADKPPLKIYHKVHLVFGDLPEPPIPSRRELVNGTIERCAQKLEEAHAECSTLNLLHGAARLRALKE